MKSMSDQVAERAKQASDLGQRKVMETANEELNRVRTENKDLILAKQASDLGQRKVMETANEELNRVRTENKDLILEIDNLATENKLLKEGRLELLSNSQSGMRHVKSSTNLLINSYVFQIIQNKIPEIVYKSSFMLSPSFVPQDIAYGYDETETSRRANFNVRLRRLQSELLLSYQAKREQKQEGQYTITYEAKLWNSFHELCEAYCTEEADNEDSVICARAENLFKTIFRDHQPKPI
jgi:hypothetical protein